MFKSAPVALVCILGLASALPSDVVLRKLDPHLRYQHAIDAAGSYHLVDTWVTLDDMAEAARYNPASENVYHLFTRLNPTVSQPLLINNAALLGLTNFNSNRRTIVLIHGWLDSVISDFNNVLVPAFLAAEDLNVIVVDWSSGGGTLNYVAALANTVTSGYAVADFLNWLSEASNTAPIQYHIVGHSLGGHQAGIVARHVNGDVAYVTGLDASLIGWVNHNERLQDTDALYVEAIHTNCGVNGYITELGHADFYPNGGESMPGCDTHECDHHRSFFYFGESLQSGGFSGRACINVLSAMLQSCNLLPGRLNMGGLAPKIGSAGIYLLETNAAPPFAQL